MERLGYTLGPVLGGVLVAAGGYFLLFATLAALGASVAGWALLMVPGVPTLPRARQTVADLARRLTSPGFVRPTLALAAATAALSVGVGFLPVVGAERGLGPLATGRSSRCSPGPPHWSNPAPAAPETTAASMTARAWPPG